MDKYDFNLHYVRTHLTSCSKNTQETKVVKIRKLTFITNYYIKGMYNRSQSKITSRTFAAERLK